MLIKFTYVDAQTRRPLTEEPAAAGPILPDAPGIAIDFGDESNWPCLYPTFYGHCDDNADPATPGILAVIDQAEFDAAKAKEDAARLNRKKSEVRSQRNWYLASTDWTQFADAPLTPTQKTHWSTYRQQLRAVPLQPGFPNEVEWPLAPDHADFDATPAVPESVSIRQARLALLAEGKLDMVDQVIAALPAAQSAAAAIEWEYATEVRRNSALLAALAPALSLDDAALDALFLVAQDL